MQFRSLLALAVVLAIAAGNSLISQSSAQSLSARTWYLPQGLPLKDSGPRTYRFTVDYNSANTKGELIYRQHVAGDYTRGLAGERSCGRSHSSGCGRPHRGFRTSQKRDFMEGFRYGHDVDTMKPDFFKGFPPPQWLSAI